MVKKGLKRIQDHVRTVPAEVAKLRAEAAAAPTTAQREKLTADLRLAEAYLARTQVGDAGKSSNAPPAAGGAL